MTTFLVLYHANTSALEQMQKSTPEEMKAGMEPWMEWAARCGKNLVDMGTPLVGGQALSTSGATDSDKGVCGFSILEAENMDHAKALLEGHPHMAWTEGCSIEVHESFALPM